MIERNNRNGSQTYISKRPAGDTIKEIGCAYACVLSILAGRVAQYRVDVG